MNRTYIVAMSLLVVVGVMLFSAAPDLTTRVIAIVMLVAGLGGVVVAIMSRRSRK